MRGFFLALTFLLVMLPTLLILFAPRRALRDRVLWALASFVTPFLMIGLVQLLPELSNGDRWATQLGRLAGIFLAAGAFLLPWIYFAIFAHRRRDP